MFERVLLTQNAFEKFEFLSRFANEIFMIFDIKKKRKYCHIR